MAVTKPAAASSSSALAPATGVLGDPLRAVLPAHPSTAAAPRSNTATLPVACLIAGMAWLLIARTFSGVRVMHAEIVHPIAGVAQSSW
jgi:hypothetical protein